MILEIDIGDPKDKRIKYIAFHSLTGGTWTIQSKRILLYVPNNSTANNILINGTSNTINSANANGTSVFGNSNSSAGDQNNFLIGSANNTPSGNSNNMLVGYGNQSSNGYLPGQYGVAVGMGVPTYLNTLIIGNSTNHGLNASALDVLNNNFNINALLTKRSFPALIIDGSNFIGVRKQSQNYGSIEVDAIEYGSGASCASWARKEATALPNTSIAARFDGDLYLNGDFNGVGTQNYPSDQIFKTNIDTITNALNIIKQLKPRTYFLDTANNYNMKFSGKKQYGFIAQHVQTVLPELVTNVVKQTLVDTNNVVLEQGLTYKALNYNAFFALLTGAIQTLEKQVHKLDSINTLQSTQIAALTTSISSCCNNGSISKTGVTGNNVNQLNISLSDADVIVLNQNVPNPFAEQTTITYNVPAKYGFAQMVFKTLDGKIIKTVDITTKGNGQMNVFASDLSNGLYMYSLIVDGKLIDSKKMVKE
jgi:hypothetical protein